MRHSLIAQSVILCSMPYWTSNRCCFSSLTFWTHRTGKHGIGRCHRYCYLLQKPDIVICTVCESVVLLKDEELSRQLTSGTHICKLVCRLKEDILGKFWGNASLSHVILLSGGIQSAYNNMPGLAHCRDSFQFIPYFDITFANYLTLSTGFSSWARHPIFHIGTTWRDKCYHCFSENSIPIGHETTS